MRDEGHCFFISWNKIFDEIPFYFIRDFFAPQRAVFYFIMTFLCDVDSHLDVGIHLE